MGRTKEVIYHNGRLRGKNLTDEDCSKLESLLRIDKQGGYIKDLQNIIWELDPSDVELLKVSKDNTMVTMKKGALSNIQTVGVAYMYFAKSLILGDSVGLGKTVEICGLCNLIEQEMLKQGQEFRCLYLTEKNLLPQTRDKLIKFTGNYVDLVWGEKKYVTRFCSENREYIQYSVVGTHSLLTNKLFQEYLIEYNRINGCYPFDLLVIDEAGDVLKNSNTKTYKDAFQIRDMFERVVILNATSFEKELGMFYNQIHFVDKTLLPTKTAFQKEYEVKDFSGPYPRFSGKYKNQEKFKSLVAYRYLARTRKSTGATMTNCTADVVVVPLSVEQKELLKRTSMPNMVYDCPSYFRTGIDTNTETTPKLAALLKILCDDWRDEKSILIYARYKEAQESIRYLLDEYCIDAVVLNGDSPSQEREGVINSFKLGDIRVLITNVQKGLDFGNCDHCIFYNYDSNPNNMVQFEGRMTRSYNIDNKHVILLISRGKELRTFKKLVAGRAEASDVFAGSDYSCVLSILLDSGKISELK